MATDKTVMAVIRAARPTFRNQNDKIAFVVHASFLASGYVLTATGPQAISDTAFSNSSNDEVPLDHWNELNDDYAFVYANPENGSKKVIVKCLVMNDKFFIDAFSEVSSELVHLEINVEEYAGEDGCSNYSQHYRNLEKLVEGIDGAILSKLDFLDGSANSSSSNKSSETSDGTRLEIHDPAVGFGRTAGPQLHPSGSGVTVPPILFGSDILHGPAGLYPSRGDHVIGESMLVGPNDPFFFGGIGREAAFPGRQPGVPPGARYDLFGPPGVPGFEPNRFARNNPRRPGFGTHLDLQHFRRDADSDYI